MRELEAVLAAESLNATIGIGHTRWATHGAPTQANANPYKAGRVALVHNGIIEKFAEMKSRLEPEVWTFKSQTDTDMVAQLSTEKSLLKAFKDNLYRLTRPHALDVRVEGKDVLILGASKGSPSVVGCGNVKMQLDSNALSSGLFNKMISYVVSQEQDVDGLIEVGRDSEVVGVRLESLGEQVGRLEQGLYELALALPVNPAEHHVGGDRERQQCRDLGSEGRGRGDADHGSPVGRAQNVGLSRHRGRVDIDYCGGLESMTLEQGQAGPGIGGLARLDAGDSEGAQCNGWGPMAGLLGYLDLARKVGQLLEDVAADLSGIEGGAAGYELDPVDPREVDGPRFQRLNLGLAGHEFVIVGQSMRDAVAMLMDSLFPEVAIGTILDHGRRGVNLDHRKLDRRTPDVEDMRHVMGDDDGIAYFLAMFLLAIEGALKLEEISYVHAQGDATGEMERGPIALIDEATLTFALASLDDVLEKSAFNLWGVASCGVLVIMVGPRIAPDPLGSAIRRIRPPP